MAGSCGAWRSLDKAQIPQNAGLGLLSHPDAVPGVRIRRRRPRTAGPYHVIDLPAPTCERQGVDRATAVGHARDPVAGTTLEERMVAHGIVALVAEAAILRAGDECGMPSQRRKCPAQSKAIPRSCAEMGNRAGMGGLEMDHAGIVGGDGLETHVRKGERRHEAVARMAPELRPALIGAKGSGTLKGQVDRPHLIVGIGAALV